MWGGGGRTGEDEDFLTAREREEEGNLGDKKRGEEVHR